MREASFYHDAPFKYSENDQDDWKTFPVSFVHIVELTSEDGLAMYGLRMRYFNGNLAMICSPVSDLSLMHDRVEYERFVIAMGYTLMKREVRENMFSVQRHIRRKRENAYVTALAAEGSATDVAEEPVDEAASCNPPHRP